ncbi:hypothetical protein [Chryseosolibacter indicus]|uniref:DUF2474 domain-containing protein n=1 Tax=Chryseosolibacter indicus TaxID=2782351 RepID=A0ABS5W2H8_9BACT|nr:hypothetical protein [Chryseosolibacter indicus]MBT1706471.1 hypothetical protein [Chryseosolibacter indicus]
MKPGYSRPKAGLKAKRAMWFWLLFMTAITTLITAKLFYLIQWWFT